MKNFFFFFFFLALALPGFGQLGNPGPLFGLGIGFGYSSHANSYQVDEIIRIKEYSGFRAFILEAKLGYVFSEKTSAQLIAKISPSNATVSPYHSSYYGIAVSQFLWGETSFYVIGGAGFTKAAVEYGQSVGDGFLGNAGFGYSFNDNFFMEVNGHFGRMNKAPDYNPNPFNPNEVNFFFTISYHIL